MAPTKLSLEKKTVRYFDDYGSGFQIRIFNAPLVKVRDEWVLAVDQNKLRTSLLESLARKPVRLTGSEIRYIRNAFEMTAMEFAEKFYVSHNTVIKWERCRVRKTGMAWPMEKDIRLFVASKLLPEPASFLAAYKELEEKADDSEMLIKIDGGKIA